MRKEMDKRKVTMRRLSYSAMALIPMLACLTAAAIIMSRLRTVIPQIAEIHYDRSQHIEIPGETNLELSREGAYAIYYIGNRDASVQVDWPPRLDCRLTLEGKGEDIPLVPDYVPTNRYCSGTRKCVGFLIFSTTIREPGLYTLSCVYPDGNGGPKLILAIGPNYIFEFLRIFWSMGDSLLGAVGVLCGSVVLSIGIATFTFIGARNKRQVG
jgi:hypothetical protein